MPSYLGSGNKSLTLRLRAESPFSPLDFLLAQPDFVAFFPKAAGCR
jgi:hypothetical protein